VLCGQRRQPAIAGDEACGLWAGAQPGRPVGGAAGAIGELRAGDIGELRAGRGGRTTCGAITPGQWQMPGTRSPAPNGSVLSRRRGRRMAYTAPHGGSRFVWLTALPGLGLAAEEEGVGSRDGIQRLAGLAVLVRVRGAVVLSNTATD
jgi:hypothetical protein